MSPPESLVTGENAGRVFLFHFELIESLSFRAHRVTFGQSSAKAQSISPGSIIAEAATSFPAEFYWKLRFIAVLFDENVAFRAANCSVLPGSSYFKALCVRGALPGCVDPGTGREDLVPMVAEDRA